MELPGSGNSPDFGAALEALVERAVPKFGELAPEHRERLRSMAKELDARGMPGAFIEASLRSTAEVLRDLREEETRPDNVFQREEVRRFVEEHAVPPEEQQRRFNLRRERKREEREQLHAHTCRLLREARQSRGRHEVKKTRNMLLKVDQRELRRMLGREGDELCRQINTWLRSTADMF
jgi:ribosomal protein L16 Arg81 hydroxylase